MNAIEIKNLKKTFADFGIEGFDLTLPTGCVMGLVGENGAGKTTTIRLILDMLKKEDGKITVLGMDNVEDNIRIKNEVGVVMDDIGITHSFDIKQVGKVMKHTFTSWDSERYEELVRKFSLPEKKPFKDFSRGMKSKLGIAIALSHDPKLLILDEPTNGLDPVARDDVMEILADFTRDESHSILISSHIVSDLEKICDYIAFIHQGKLLVCEEKDRLLEDYCIIHCSAEEISAIAPTAVRHRKETPYGIEAIVLREAVSEGMKVSPISIEELFISVIKEGK